MIINDSMEIYTEVMNPSRVRRAANRSMPRCFTSRAMHQARVFWATIPHEASNEPQRDLRVANTTTDVQKWSTSGSSIDPSCDFFSPAPLVILSRVTPRWFNNKAEGMKEPSNCCSKRREAGNSTGASTKAVGNGGGGAEAAAAGFDELMLREDPLGARHPSAAVWEARGKVES